MNPNETINNYLEDAKERACAAHAKGNRWGAMYLAMIAGMWNHNCRNVEPYGKTSSKTKPV